MTMPLLDLPQTIAWTPWWAAASLLTGLSVAGFALALPGRAFGLPRWQRPSRLGLLLALAAGIAAPACMLAALHRPDRVGLLYSHADGTSWLTTGATLMPAYLAALAVFAWTTLRRDLAAATGRSLLSRLHRVAALGGGGAPRLRMLAMLATGALGAAMLLATGAELSPAWSSPLLPWHLILTALAGALGAVLLLDRLAGAAIDRATTARLCQGATIILVAGMAIGRESWTAVPVLAEAASVLIALAAPARLGWLAGLLALAAAWGVRWHLVMADAAPIAIPDLAAPLGMAGLLLVLLPGIAALAPVLGPRRARET